MYLVAVSGTPEAHAAITTDSNAFLPSDDDTLNAEICCAKARIVSGSFT